MKYWFLWPLILSALGGAAVLVFYPKVLTGNYADLEIDSITSPAPGEATLQFHGRIAKDTYLSGGSWQTWAETPGFAGRARRLEAATMKVYTIRNDRGELASPQEVLGRFSVQAGKSYRIRPNRPLTLFRYTTHDGDAAELTLIVWTE